MKIDGVDSSTFNAIPEGIRWTLANALRAAADRWKELVGMEQLPISVRAHFAFQIEEVEYLADCLEDC